MAVYKSKWKGAEIDAHLDTVDTLSTNVSTLQTQNTTNVNDISNLKTQANASTNAITSIQSSLAAVDTYTSARTGAEIDADLDYLELLMAYNSEPVSMQWDTTSSSSALEIVDINGDTLSTNTKFYNNHVLWGGMWRWARDRTTGTLTRGSNPRGDGLALDGSMGDILTSIPTGQVEFQVVGDYLRWTVSPFVTETNLCPAAWQRGGNPRSVIYVGSFEASIRDFANNPKLQSISGAEPFVGDKYKRLAFTLGTSAIVTGDTITGQTSNVTATVVYVDITSGTWTGGNAAGTLYLKSVSGSFTNPEILLVNSVSSATVNGSTLSFSGIHSSMETYGNNLGSGFGICNIHTYGWLKLLMAMEFKTFNIQTALERGVVDVSSGSGFLGKNTGADSIYSHLSTNGTGHGNGVDGLTPICYRTIENIYGNMFENIAGINLTSTGDAYILPEKGTSAITIPDILTTYTTITGIPLSADSYITSLLTSRLGALDFLPATNSGGTNATNMCDNFYYPKYATSLCSHGGYASSQSAAGPFCLSGSVQASTVNSYTGCRLEYIPQGGLDG